MKKLITIIAIILFAYTAKANNRLFNTPIKTDTVPTATDPVCKMKVKPRSSKTESYNKSNYYFCSESCRQKFVAKPSMYIKK